MSYCIITKEESIEGKFILSNCPVKLFSLVFLWKERQIYVLKDCIDLCWGV